MTLEEVQAMLLAEQEKNATLTNEIELHKSTISTHETNIETLKNDLTNARDLNSKLALKVSTQTLSPKEEPIKKEEEKVLSFDEIINKL